MNKLRDNLAAAEKRLQSTLKRFRADDKYKEDYKVAIEKYLKNGYAEVIYEYEPGSEQEKGDLRGEPGQFFLPHHGVYKNEQRLKLRVVFDSAAKTHGLSLNDVMYAGPKLQAELPHVIMKFREHEVAYIADVSDMFSRIHLSPEDAKRHRFLWQFEGSQKFSVIQMNSLTFGDGASPHVALATVHKTAEELSLIHI